MGPRGRSLSSLSLIHPSIPSQKTFAAAAALAVASSAAAAPSNTDITWAFPHAPMVPRTVAPGDTLTFKWDQPHGVYLVDGPSAPAPGRAALKAAAAQAAVAARSVPPLPAITCEDGAGFKDASRTVAPSLEAANVEGGSGAGFATWTAPAVPGNYTFAAPRGADCGAGMLLTVQVVEGAGKEAPAEGVAAPAAPAPASPRVLLADLLKAPLPERAPALVPAVLKTSSAAVGAAEPAVAPPAFGAPFLEAATDAPSAPAAFGAPFLVDESEAPPQAAADAGRVVALPGFGSTTLSGSDPMFLQATTEEAPGVTPPLGAPFLDESAAPPAEAALDGAGSPSNDFHFAPADPQSVVVMDDANSAAPEAANNAAAVPPGVEGEEPAPQAAEDEEDEDEDDEDEDGEGDDEDEEEDDGTGATPAQAGEDDEDDEDDDEGDDEEEEEAALDTDGFLST